MSKSNDKKNSLAKLHTNKEREAVLTSLHTIKDGTLTAGSFTSALLCTAISYLKSTIFFIHNVGNIYTEHNNSLNTARNTWNIIQHSIALLNNSLCWTNLSMVNLLPVENKIMYVYKYHRCAM